MNEAQAQRLTEAAKLLRQVHKRLRILKVIAWPREVRERFFARGQDALPRVEYRRYDPTTELECCARACELAPHDPVVGPWLRRQAQALRLSARMLGAMGTPKFSRHSQALYGRPSEPFPHTERTPLELARRLVQTMQRLSGSVPEPPAPNLSAQAVAAEITAAVRGHFGSQAPRVEVVPTLAARASAAPSKIRLRRGVRFSDLDVRQLIQHEAFVHVATALNGRRQIKVPILAQGHAGTTRTQEGLAVFAELVSGALDPRRLLRLAHRVIAVQMALDGADFLEVYHYYLDHSPNEIEAFESTARIFRGGVVKGGAPFTKDMVYLDGLCRVHVFVRAAVDTGRVDCLELLFMGKLDLQDVPALVELRRQGMCRAPRFVPPWVSDPRRLVAYFALTDVIGRASTAGLRKHYAQWLGSMHEIRAR
ncbi:MAG: flavohemoglobin expression-modulating QEGLA motif protein [Myxococcota bacterium]